jgi:hypothetical protein
MHHPHICIDSVKRNLNVKKERKAVSEINVFACVHIKVNIYFIIKWLVRFIMLYVLKEDFVYCNLLLLWRTEGRV